MSALVAGTWSALLWMDLVCTNHYREAVNAYYSTVTKLLIHIWLVSISLDPCDLFIINRSIHWLSKSWDTIPKYAAAHGPIKMQHPERPQWIFDLRYNHINQGCSKLTKVDQMIRILVYDLGECSFNIGGGDGLKFVIIRNFFLDPPPLSVNLRWPPCNIY